MSTDLEIQGTPVRVRGEDYLEYAYPSLTPWKIYIKENVASGRYRQRWGRQQGRSATVFVLLSMLDDLVIVRLCISDTLGFSPWVPHHPVALQATIPVLFQVEPEYRSVLLDLLPAPLGEE